MLAGIRREVMVRRVPVEKKVDGNVRDTLSSWLAWAVRRERITREGEVTPRLNDLERLLDLVRQGHEVEIHADNLPPHLANNSRRRFLLTGDRLIQK